ncbi:MAG: choline/carnitine O-acyltransferase [Acidobacteriota bacterium]|nr:choline/carnitine O-acyltransferase [Acidobacteriota bacterium]
MARWLVRAALWLSGFDRFRRDTLSLERALSTDDGSRPVTGPLFSAVLPLIDDPECLDPYRPAARLASGVWGLHADFRAGRFAPDEHRGRPLESRGYLNLFGTHFIFDGDTFRVHKTDQLNRLVVASGATQFRVALDLQAARPTEEQLLDVLTQLPVSTGSSLKDTLGTLSGAGQATQAEGLNRLLESPANRVLYEQLAHSFVVVCLDMESHPASFEEAARRAFVGNCANAGFMPVCSSWCSVTGRPV